MFTEPHTLLRNTFQSLIMINSSKFWWLCGCGFSSANLLLFCPSCLNQAITRLRCEISLEKHKLGTNFIPFQMQTRLKFNRRKPFASLSYLLFQEFGHFFMIWVYAHSVHGSHLCVCCMTYTYMQHSTIALT